MHRLIATSCLLIVTTSVSANPLTQIPEPEILSLLGLAVASMLLVIRRSK